MGLHFLAFWPCGLSFPCILAFSGSASGVPPPQVAKNGLFAQRPYNGFSSAVTGPILQFFSLLGLHCLAFWHCAFISLHFGLVGLHFLAFWPFRLSFPCMLALWAFIPCNILGRQLRRNRQRADPSRCPISESFCLMRPPLDRGHCAFISLHFGLVGLHFLAFWPFRLSFPCMLALWAFIPCNILGRQLRRNRQRADPSRCPISESFCLMCPPLDRGARGVDNPKPVKVKMRVERQRGWDLTATARARRLRPLGRGAPLPVDTLNPKTLNPKTLDGVTPPPLA